MPHSIEGRALPRERLHRRDDQNLGPEAAALHSEFAHSHRLGVVPQGQREVQHDL